MQTIPAAAGMSALAILVALLFTRTDSAPPSRLSFSWLPAAGLAALLAFLCFGATLPSSKPFSEGGHLGWGILLGAALALALLGISLVRPGASSGVIPLALAALNPTLVLMIFHGDPTDALLGAALGAVGVAVLVAGTARMMEEAAGGSARELLIRRTMELHALAAVTVATAARLGIERFPRMKPNGLEIGYWATPGLLLALGCLALFLFYGQAWSDRATWRPLIQGMGAAVFALVGVALLNARGFPLLSFRPIMWGAAGFALLLYLLLASGTVTREALEPPEPRDGSRGFVALLVALGVVALAFREMQAYGQAMALVGAALVMAPLCMAIIPRGASAGASGDGTTSPDRPAEPSSIDSEGSHEETTALAMGAWSLVLLFTLYRLFLERADQVRSFDFQQQYNLVAALIGVMIVFLLPGWGARSREALRDDLATGNASGAVALPSVFFAGTILALLPLFLGFAWGARATGAYLIGLILAAAVWLLLAAWERRETPSRPSRILNTPPHLLFVGSAVVAVQLTPVLARYDIPHALRVKGVVAVAVLILISLALSLRPRPNPVHSPKGDIRD